MNRFENLKELFFLFRSVIVVFCLVLLVGVTTFILHNNPGLFNSVTEEPAAKEEISVILWKAPELSSIPDNEDGRQIQYGHDLIARTSNFIGPLGTVSLKANGMNCQNCHLEAGTKPYGNNFGSVASMYPKFRNRSGALESIEKRVNDCFERSLNGKSLDSLSKEMRAIVAYIQWVGKDVPKGKKANGSGLYELNFLDRAADTTKGKIVFEEKCVVCHGKGGEGLKRFDGHDYVYPTLWGENSFNNGAGLFRLSNFAKYIFANMPLGTSHDSPTLTAEQAWDVAAYVVSLPRPEKQVSTDWPKLETKPVDHPFGPYADSFSETQHKFGPFKPILESRK